VSYAVDDHIRTFDRIPNDVRKFREHNGTVWILPDAISRRVLYHELQTVTEVLSETLAQARLLNFIPQLRLADLLQRLLLEDQHYAQRVRSFFRISSTWSQV
jgi:hypothetical protein